MDRNIRIMQVESDSSVIPSLVLSTSLLITVTWLQLWIYWNLVQLFNGSGGSETADLYVNAFHWKVVYIP